MTLKLYVGNRNYSSWSLRPWLVLEKSGLTYEDEVVPLDVPGYKQAILNVSPAGTVPVLHVEGAVIYESLAIAEWIAEQAPHLWPSDPITRAKARAAAALMHSGFFDLRAACPMNMRRRDGVRTTDEGALADAARIDGFWQDWLGVSGGPFLFGDWSIADAFYAPVVSRFVTYSLPRSDASQAYLDRTETDAAYAKWLSMANAETWKIAAADAC